MARLPSNIDGGVGLGASPDCLSQSTIEDIQSVVVAVDIAAQTSAELDPSTIYEAGFETVAGAAAGIYLKPTLEGFLEEKYNLRIDLPQETYVRGSVLLTDYIGNWIKKNKRN